MAYTSNANVSLQSALAARFEEWRMDLRARLARRRVYKQTFGELSALSNRELADLGLNRTEIRRIAYQAAYEL
ncbi:DUF1127 domain-containing protein [Thalassococcus lentus]